MQKGLLASQSVLQRNVERNKTTSKSSVTVLIKTLSCHPNCLKWRGNNFGEQTLRTVSRICQHYILCHVHVERQLKTARGN